MQLFNASLYSSFGNSLIGFPEQNSPSDCFASLPDFWIDKKISSSADGDLGRCPKKKRNRTRAFGLSFLKKLAQNFVRSLYFSLDSFNIK
ncbi:hypothetical protein [Neglectibacter sp. CSJ-5]|uniref:hypothetical protein n=1 Tax=Neglectibacter sp. CSJ-5 TaxID=3078043 RepID=UPI0029301B99|nr:hypothetical protein [Neglectibacter sp. CSJ-5]